MNALPRRSDRLEPGSPAAPERPFAQSRRTVFAASAVHTLAVLPIILLGALAVLIRDDLGFSETQLGAAVSLFLAVSAIGSVPGGRIVQRIGAYRAMSLVALVDGIALLGIALQASAYLHLVLWLLLAGTVNALSQPSTSLAIAGGVSPARQGFAFGIKQSALPAATLLGGLAVPGIGLTVGWRWAYAAAALGAVMFAFAMPRGGLRRVKVMARPTTTESRTATLVILAIGAGLGTTAINASGAFYVASAVDHGVSAGAAGIWFAFGSVVCIGTRTGWGWLADRRNGANLAVVSLLMAAGAVGYALLPYAADARLLAIGTALAFGAGWGWMGLFQLTIVRQNPDAPASALGITQTGAFIGAAIGPVSFGALAEHISYTAAWGAAAVALLAGAALIRTGRRMLIADRSARDIAAGR